MSAHYLESSALLRAVTLEDRALTMRLPRMKRRIASQLSLVEVERTLRRIEREKLLRRSAVREIRRRLEELLAATEVIEITSSILERARQDFPVEPVRSLDAIHLATALEWHQIEDTVVVTYDRRVWDNAVALKLNVVPSNRPGAPAH